MSLKKTVIDFVKRSSVISNIGYFARRKTYSKRMKAYSNTPLENKIMFYRGGKGYGDNPRCVSERLHTLYPELEQVWACSSANDSKYLPDYVRPVAIGSNKYYEDLASSKVWVSSVLMPEGIRKKEGQMYIQTWHGDRAFKKIVNDAMDNKYYQKRKRNRHIAEVDICDYFVTGSEFAEKMYRSAIGYKGAYLKCGCPRNDCLFNADHKKDSEIRKMIKIDTDVKIALYAPTFRDHSSGQGVVNSDIDLSRLLDALESKEKKQWVILKRAHGSDSLKTQKEIANRIVDVTTYPDIADLLMICDLLITDYSSCATDFVITGKPVLIYQDDYNEYVSKDRSLYFKMEDSPFWRATNMDELLRLVNEINDDKAKQNDKEILNFFGCYENGNATESICEMIIRLLE